MADQLPVPMVLAICINAAISENSLILGEYYAIRFLVRKQHPDEPGLHQGNVMVYYIGDEDMRAENFQRVTGGDSLFEPVFDLRKKLLTGPPVYIGPKARFDILDTDSQMKTATYRALERLGLTKAKR